MYSHTSSPIIEKYFSQQGFFKFFFSLSLFLHLWSLNVQVYIIKTYATLCLTGCSQSSQIFALMSCSQVLFCPCTLWPEVAIKSFFHILSPTPYPFFIQKFFFFSVSTGSVKSCSFSLCSDDFLVWKELRVISKPLVYYTQQRSSMLCEFLIIRFLFLQRQCSRQKLIVLLYTHTPIKVHQI